MDGWTKWWVSRWQINGRNERREGRRKTKERKEERGGKGIMNKLI